MNHLFYADDAVLLAPSPYAIQQLISACEHYAGENDMSYNTKKTVCMFICPKRFKHIKPPSIQLHGRKLN